MPHIAPISHLMPSIFFQPDAQAIVANFTPSAKSDAVNLLFLLWILRHLAEPIFAKISYQLVEKYFALHTNKHARRDHFARRAAFDASSHRVNPLLQRVDGQFDTHISREALDDAARSAQLVRHATSPPNQ